MADVLIRNIAPQTLDRIKAKANQANRSVQAEMKRILETAANNPDTLEELELMRSIRESLKYPQKTKSVDIIRAGRNR